MPKGNAKQPGGKKGPVRGSMTSSTGGQHGHLPGPKSYPNAGVQRPTTTNRGQNPSSVKNGPKWPHMPSKPGGSKKG